MTSTEILGPPITVDAPQRLHSMEALAGLPVAKGKEAIELSNCFNAAAQKEQLSAMNVGGKHSCSRIWLGPYPAPEPAIFPA